MVFVDHILLMSIHTDYTPIPEFIITSQRYKILVQIHPKNKAVHNIGNSSHVKFVKQQ